MPVVGRINSCSTLAVPLVEPDQLIFHLTTSYDITVNISFFPGNIALCERRIHAQIFMTRAVSRILSLVLFIFKPR